MAELPIDVKSIEAFCRKYRIRRMALFGSALRADFRPDSDVDVLVDFEPDVRYTLLDLVQMEEELQYLFGRPVDLVEMEALRQSKNHIRRQEILQTAEPLYEAG